MKHARKKYFLKDRTGLAAVEFALVAPLLLLFMFGIISFGMLLGVYNAVQQLAAEAARASVAGLSSTEQAQLAQAYVTNNIGAYGLLKASQVTVTTQSQTNTFTVTVSYNMSGSIFFQLGQVLSKASPVITRSAVVQNGGF